jgi:hypothetical protein
MRANKKEQISVQDIRRDALAQGLDEKETRDLLDAMVKAGWLREAAIETRKGPGRHARRWEVSPLLHGGAGIAGIAEIGCGDAGDPISAIPAIPAPRRDIRT